MTETTTTARPITPRDRFAAYDRQHAEPLGSPAYRAINAARYWEAFPESYTPAQVAAAQDLIAAIGDGHPIPVEIVRVLNLLKHA